MAGIQNAQKDTGAIQTIKKQEVAPIVNSKTKNSSKTEKKVDNNANPIQVKNAQPQASNKDTISTVTTRDSVLVDYEKEPIEKATFGDSEQTEVSAHSFDWVLIGGAISVVLFSGMLFFWYKKTRKKQKKAFHKDITVREEETGEPTLIIVGQRSQTALKKLNIADVYDNEAYYKIECKDFCSDSAVRNIYIKNTCIKELYNMYAEDLRNPDNPKEDGCMVLGRWVFEESLQQYEITLEQIVLPGDDAIFEEYELNFGGKIKLKMSEKLRRLRRETDLQYDLTCWVHSHPGLGVFFSNSDNNVHHQLKHPVHPKFLIAFVVDILTPEQEMGIFTFKQDETINSKNDLIKMYSLDNLYKWALASERKSFDVNNHFDTLNQAQTHLNECFGVQLSNGAIIDMTFLTAKPNGFIGYVHGYTIERGDKIHYIVNTVTNSESAADNEILGCFVVASHCSIPSISKAVANYLRVIRFVLVYTATDGLLTTIPVMSQELCMRDTYYGEQQLENLKIWTRRRR